MSLSSGGTYPSGIFAPDVEESETTGLAAAVEFGRGGTNHLDRGLLELDTAGVGYRLDGKIASRILQTPGCWSRRRCSTLSAAHRPDAGGPSAYFDLSMLLFSDASMSKSSCWVDLSREGEGGGDKREDAGSTVAEEVEANSQWNAWRGWQ
ncbi:hypothetical protein Ptr902_14054 [Pyrenophora tritici-repentis]|nr:hypothetical protein Ptr902_14054 [Pyrenophora tritici-repentis]